MPLRARALGETESEIAAVEQDAAGRRLDDAGDDAERGRLACSVGAQQRDHFAGVDSEVHIPDHGGLVVARSQPFDLKHRAHETAPASTPSSADTSAPAVAEVRADHLRIAADGLRRPVRDDLAELEHDDVVGDGQDEAHVVIDEQRRRALVDGLAQMAAERFALERVEPGGGLVEAEQPR